MNKKHTLLYILIIKLLFVSMKGGQKNDEKTHTPAKGISKLSFVSANKTCGLIELTACPHLRMIKMKIQLVNIFVSYESCVINEINISLIIIAFAD